SRSSAAATSTGPATLPRASPWSNRPMPLKNAVAALVAVVLIAVLPASATPQQPNSDAYRMQASRPELVATLGRLRELARSPSPRGRIRSGPHDRRLHQ